MSVPARALPRPILARFVAWTVAVALLLAVFFIRVMPSLQFETDILALLPNAHADRAMDDALDQFASRISRTQIFLIGADDAERAKKSAAEFARALRDSGAMTDVTLEFNADLQARLLPYIEHRGFLLARADVGALEANKVEALEAQAVRAAYTPAGLVTPIGLSEDPLGLLNRFVQAQSLSLGNAQLDGNVATVERDGKTYVLVTATTKGSPFASSVQDEAVPAVEHAKASAREAGAITVLTSGALQHAAAATDRAKFEISLFGSIETLGVILLLWSVFGALRPLGLATLTLGVATLAALTAVHFVFGKVHILALVFGSSLIGSVIDYSIHFFADRFREPERWTPVDAVHHVGGAILLGLTTTLIGYVVLALVPFPGLTQIATFCAVGLAAGCACVLCWYPVLASRGRKPPPSFGGRVGAAIDRFLANWRWTRARIGVVAIGGALVLLGLFRLHVVDDVRSLQSSPPELIEAESRVRELLGTGVETRFFLVTGDSEQDVLQAEEALASKLDALVAQGALKSYQAVSNAVPPLERQLKTHRLLEEQVYAPSGALERVLKMLGFPDAAIAKRRAQFDAASAPLELAAWLKTPAADTLRHLWLGKVGERFATIVTLGGISDVPALASVEGSHATLVDRVASTSEILTRYRRMMSWLLILIYSVAGIVLTVRFGWRDAPRMLLPSALATATTVALFGWFGVPLNLFTLLGFWLVLGLGIDYGIFLRHGQEGRDARARATAVLSVTLSACTTLLAFGPLSFSATPFIHSIGLTLLCAIMLSWLLVMFSCLTTRNVNRN